MCNFFFLNVYIYLHKYKINSREFFQPPTGQHAECPAYYKLDGLGFHRASAQCGQQNNILGPTSALEKKKKIYPLFRPIISTTLNAQ